ncbi:MAG TPA: response regulator [Polyangia bacterium]|nr:response regulator [Polyangia bacterium]
MSPPRVLVVEPSAPLRKLIRVALEGEGYVVLDAADGATALAERERFGPDVVVQDLVLPDMVGLELTRQLRASSGGDALPILAVSGFLGGVQAARVAAAGFSGLMLKPLDPARVIEAVNAHIPAERHHRPDIGKARRVLVVDDDPVQLRLLTYQLEAAGFQVHHASSGEAALQLARDHPPDAIVSDVLMPGTDGFELCLQVRRDAALAHIPLLLVSYQYIEAADLDFARRVGATRFVQRPVRSRELVEAVLELISNGVAPEPSASVDFLNRTHVHRVNRQLGRQVSLATRLAQTAAIQASQLSLLGGMADTLARGGAVDGLLEDLLPGCLDAAGISKGALFLVAPDGSDETLTCRPIVGFRREEEGALGDFFGCPSVLQQVVATGVAVRLPSTAMPREVTRRVLAGAGAKAALVVPLGSDHPRVGVLFAASDAPAANGSAPLAFLKALGSQIGQAIALAESFSQLTRALAVRDEFLTIAAHELRTPLTAARLQVQGLAREAVEAASSSSAVKALPAKVSVISRQLARLEGLVDLLLDTTRADHRSMVSRREPVELRELVRATVAVTRDESPESSPLVTLAAGRPVTGQWDRAALEAVVRNLVSNAIKFSCNQPIDISVEQHGDRAALAVRDRGIGIAPEDHERIFGKFERAVATRNYGGWGVGLWLARRHVEAHGGTIRVESVLNEGATFIVELPLRPPGEGSLVVGHADTEPVGLLS